MGNVQKKDSGEDDGLDLDILILCAGVPRGMKSNGPLSNFEIYGQETITGRQIRILKERFPLAQITFVGGFQAETAFKTLPSDILKVENELYEDCSIGRSVELGARVCIRKRLMLVYGDLIFNEKFLEDVPKKGSWAFLTERDTHEVGANTGKNKVRLFNYSIANPKWAQVAIFDGLELTILKEMLENYRDKLGHEIMNGILRKGGEIGAHYPDGKLFEVDSKEDLVIAKRRKI